MDPGTELSNENISGLHGLTSVDLDASTLAWTVAAVARRALSFFVRHGWSPAVEAALPRRSLAIPDAPALKGPA
jgi:hypothetical protein